MKKLSCLLAFWVVVVFLGNQTTYAQQEFTTNYDVYYVVQPDGKTHVTQDIEIINEHKDIIPTTYSLIIKQITPTNVEAESGEDELAVEIIEKGETGETGETEIKIALKNVAIGEDKATKFQVRYVTDDITTKVGEVWNVAIPRVSLLENTQRYQVILSIPATFGPEIFISPDTPQKEAINSGTAYTFTKDTLESTGVSAAFGNFQLVNFSLDYSLVNESNFYSTQEIALPPDIIGSQQIAYKNLSPPPSKIYTDADGNVLAVYKLKGKQTLNVTLTGTARLTGRQINPSLGGFNSEIPTELRNQYTQATTFWQSDAPQIQEIARSLYNADLTVSENAQNAYNFVTSKLSYDFNILQYDFVDRKGAVLALASATNNGGQGIGCMEFTDLFISIVRAMGIPARELNGHAFTNEAGVKNPISINLKGGDVLHAWAEFYDPKFGWVQVDPTWGSTSDVDYFTKLDTNHLVFAIKGQDPLFPLPAGLYKTDEAQDQQKQVEVDFAQTVDESVFVPQISVSKSLIYNPIKLLQQKKPYYLTNTGQVTFYYEHQQLIPQESELIYLSQNEQVLELKDAVGKTHTIAVQITNKYKHLLKDLNILAKVLVAVTALCMILYVLTIRLKAPQKLTDRLRHRLRGRGQ